MGAGQTGLNVQRAVDGMACRSEPVRNPSLREEANRVKVASHDPVTVDDAWTDLFGLSGRHAPERVVLVCSFAHASAIHLMDVKARPNAHARTLFVPTLHRWNTS